MMWLYGELHKVLFLAMSVTLFFVWMVWMVRARCKQRHAAADGTIPSLAGGDFGSLCAVYVR